MQRWFITGTDTEIGKTSVTAILAAGLRSLQHDVLAIKPLMSGAHPDSDAADSTRIARAAGHSPQVHTWWNTPISPHRAAWTENKPLDIQSLKSWIRSHIAEYVLIEGVGGWRVPLSMTLKGTTLYTVSDLAKDSTQEIILVAANKLGVLNHVLLTLEAIERDGFVVRGVILNQVHPETSSISEKTNYDDLRHLLNIPVAQCPFIPEGKTALYGDEGVKLLRTLGLI